MTPIPTPTAGLAVDPNTSLVRSNQIASPNGRPQRELPLLRKYDVAHLTPSLEIKDRSLMAPVTPAFQDAFAVYGRGALLTTPAGPVAVEDLIPGDMVQTHEYGFQKLLWHGAMTFAPSDATDVSMIRVASDTGEFATSNPDLILGPSARVKQSSPYAEAITGSKQVFIPAADLVDGQRYISVRPMTAVPCFQIGFARHCSIQLNGQLVETLHPGPAFKLPLRAAMKDHYLSLFGHVKAMADFGPMIAPRLRQADLDLVAA